MQYLVTETCKLTNYKHNSMQTFTTPLCEQSLSKRRRQSVLIETSLGDIVIDLHTEECPQTSLNFLKLCKIKFYNFSPFHFVQKGFIAQAGDPTGKGDKSESIYGILNGPKQRYFPAEIRSKLKHKTRGTVSMAATSDVSVEDEYVSGSQFFITLGDSLDYLDGKHTVFGEVAEGFDVLEKLNEAFCDEKGRPFRDIRIRHTIILDDPFEDPEGLQVPDESPKPTKEQLDSMRIAEDEDIEEQGDEEEIEKRRREREAKAQAITLEMVGDIPFAEVKPPENVLFVCKLNPVTRDEDLELIFSRFGEICSCEIIRDRKTGDSLCYAFIEYENKEAAEEAFFKMQGALVDDRRIHVDFSQSVSKLHQDWISKRMTGAGGESMGGFDTLKRKTQYRDTASGLHGDSYDLVFEEGKTKDEKRSRSRSTDRRKSSEQKRGHHEESRPKDSRNDGRRRDYSNDRRRDNRDDHRRDNRDDHRRDNRDDRRRDHRDDRSERHRDRRDDNYSRDRKRSDRRRED